MQCINRVSTHAQCPMPSVSIKNNNSNIFTNVPFRVSETPLSTFRYKSLSSWASFGKLTETSLRFPVNDANLMTGLADPGQSTVME